MIGALGVLGSLVLTMVIQRSANVFLLAMAAPLVVGLLLMLWFRRVGAIWLGVVSLALLVFSAPFLIDALTHPESLADFIPLSIFTVGALVGVVAAIPSFRQGTGPDRPSRPARAIAVAAGVVLLAAGVIGVVAFAGIESVPAQPGDIRVVAEDIAFHPAQLSSEGGASAVHVTNRDTTLHTFTIDELGIDVSVPPGSSQRITLDAAPGTYRFYCRPHAPDMDGELVVV